VARVLLDANVLISAVIRPRGAPGRIVAAFLEHEAFDLVISPATVTEVEVALQLPKIRRYLRDVDEALAWLADLVALADLVTDTGAVRGVCRDPDDDAVLSAAVEGRADVIVTGDNDLLELGAFEGIQILAPREFLASIDS
jgi:putative PIN family toxin of toxin-antitoxin system